MLLVPSWGLPKKGEKANSPLTHLGDILGVVHATPRTRIQGSRGAEGAGAAARLQPGRPGLPVESPEVFNWTIPTTKSCGRLLNSLHDSG